MLLVLLAGAAAAQDADPDLPTLAIESLRETAEVPALAPEPPPTLLPPITVIATRTERRLNEIAESVARIDQDMIEAQQASSLGEALRHTVGVNLEGGPRPAAEFVNIRGLSGARVLFVVDGARQNFVGGHRSALLLDPDAVHSIEILRGPASALYGSDALGGVVAVQTRSAQDLLDEGALLGGSLRAGYEDNADERMLAGTLGLRLGELDLFANHAQRSQDDYEDGDGKRIEYTALDTDSSLVKLGWHLGRDHQLRLSAQSFGQEGLSPSNPALAVGETNPLLDRDSRQRYLNAHYGYDGAGRRLAALAINLYRSDSRFLEDRINAPRRDLTEFETDGFATRLTLALPRAHRLSVGGEVYEDRASAERDGAPRPQYPDSRRRIAGVFVQDEWRWGALGLTPALRWDRYEAQSRTGAARDIAEQATSLKLGATLAATEALTLRASYGEAFRAPNLIELYPVGQHFLGNEFRPNPDLRPEQAANLELGVDLRLGGLVAAEDRLDLRASVYRNRIEDFIETVVVEDAQFGAPQCLALRPPAGCVNRNEDGTLNPFVPPVFVGGFTQSQNLNDAEIRGAEAELAYALGGWRLALGYSLVRGENKGDGEPLLNIPADTLRAELGYRDQGGLSLALGATRVAAQTRVPRLEDGSTVAPVTAAYTLLDASLVWEPQSSKLRAFKLVLGADNLANETYRSHLNALNSPGRNLRTALHYRF